MKRSITALVGLACVTGVASSASAQGSWSHVNIKNANGGVINPANPSVEVTISMMFDPQDYAFAAALFSLQADEAGWSNNTVLLPPPGNPGTIVGGSINGITLGQIHFPPVVIANPENPIDLFRATWTTSDFTVRPVDVRTVTTRYDVYIDVNSPVSQSRLAGLMEASGEIRIVPAPSALALLGLGAFVAGRRRR